MLASMLAINPNGVTVANLSVRKLDDRTFAQLRVRAAQHGVSMEEEVRRIIKAAVSPQDLLGDLFVSVFGQENGTELKLPSHPKHEPLVLED